MTTYNTGNPIGSTDARDLYDNAQNLDNFVNGTSASYTDRLGVSRRSLSGIDSAADSVLNGIGYAVPVAYASGISMTLTSQTVEYAGEIYAPKSSALPFTTSSWGADSAKFRLMIASDASRVNYTPAGTDAVATTVQAKLRAMPINVVEDFGADPTGEANSTTAINNAIAAGISLGRKVFIPSGTYIFNGYTNTSQAISVDIEGAAANWPRLVKTQAAANAGGYMFLLCSSRYSTVSGLTLAVAIKPNQQKISLTSVTGLSAGMVIQISSNRLWYNGNRGTKYCGEIHKITDVDAVANTVTIEDFTRDVYALTDTLTIRAWTPNKVSIKNLDIFAPYPATAVTSVGIALQQCDGSIIENVKLQGFTNSMILDNLGWKPIYRNVRFAQDDDLDTAISAGYGVDTNGSVGMLVDGLYSKGLRRAFDADEIAGTTEAAVTRDWKVTNFQVIGGGAWSPVTAAIGYGLGSHGPSENGIISSGFIQDCHNGVTARGRNTIVENVTFSGTFNDCISFHEEAAGLVVRNCVYENYNYPDKFANLADIVADSGCATFLQMGLASGGSTANCLYTLPVIVESNICKGLTNAFMQFGQNGRVVIGLRVVNNYIQAVPGAAGTFTTFNATSSATNWTNSVLSGNEDVAINGTLVTYSTNLVMAYRDPANSTLDFRVDGVYWARIPDDSFVRIPRIAPAGRRVLQIAHADAGGYGFNRLIPNNIGFTAVGNGTPASWVATATGASLNGTTGVDGSMTFGLEADGDIYIENRLGTTYNFRFTYQ